MGSATRESLERATASLDGVPELSLIAGEQLLAAGRAIGGSSQLRAVLGDPSIEATEKGQLVESIFAAVDPAARGILHTMAESRWSSPAQFLASVEEIGIRVISRASGNDGSIESELFAFAKAVESDAELELALGSKLGDSSRRVALVDRLLEGRASEATLILMRYVVQNQRGRRIGDLIAHIADVVADDSGAIVATVTAAAEPSKDQLKRLRAALSQRYGSALRLNLTVDEQLVGGLRVQVADEVVDGSIANRLADLRLRLAG